MNLHKDYDDILTAVLHVGFPRSGGGLELYGGASTKNPRNLLHTFLFSHGYIHIGSLYDILHGVQPWTGAH